MFKLRGVLARRRHDPVLEALQEMALSVVQFTGQLRTLAENQVQLTVKEGQTMASVSDLSGLVSDLASKLDAHVAVVNQLIADWQAKPAGGLSAEEQNSFDASVQALRDSTAKLQGETGAVESADPHPTPPPGP